MSHTKLASRYILGLIVMSIGTLLLLQNLGYIDFTIPPVIFSWQVLLIIIGSIFILNSENASTGLVFIIVGGLGLIPEYWPIVLVLIGLYIVFKSSSINKSNDPANSRLDAVLIFGGGNNYFSTDNLTGGNVTAIFSSSTIDLTGCKLSKGESVIKLLYIFGGASFIIPKDWNVRIETTSIFGRFSDKRIIATDIERDNEKVLVFKGLTLFSETKIINI